MMELQIAWHLDMQSPLRKLCENTGFLWSVLPRLLAESTISTEKTTVSENPYYHLFYTLVLRLTLKITMKFKIWHDSKKMTNWNYDFSL